MSASIDSMRRSCTSGFRTRSYTNQQSVVAVVSYPAIINMIELMRISSSVRAKRKSKEQCSEVTCSIKYNGMFHVAWL